MHKRWQKNSFPYEAKFLYMSFSYQEHSEYQTIGKPQKQEDEIRDLVENIHKACSISFVPKWWEEERSQLQISGKHITTEDSDQVLKM